MVDGGISGGGGKGGAVLDGGFGTGGASPEKSTGAGDEGGCGCRAPAGQAGGAGLLLIAAGLLALRTRSRLSRAITRRPR